MALLTGLAPSPQEKTTPTQQPVPGESAAPAGPDGTSANPTYANPMPTYSHTTYPRGDDVFGRPRRGPSACHVAICRFFTWPRIFAGIYSLTATLWLAIRWREIYSGDTEEEEKPAWEKTQKTGGILTYLTWLALALLIVTNIFFTLVVWTIDRQTRDKRGGMLFALHLLLALVLAVGVSIVSYVALQIESPNPFWVFLAIMGDVLLHEAFWVTWVRCWACRYGMPARGMYRKHEHQQ